MMQVEEKMTRDTSFKLDRSARLWIRSRSVEWRLASLEETETIYLTHPEITLQAFWNLDSSK